MSTSDMQAAAVRRAAKTRRRKSRRVTVARDELGRWRASTNYGLTGSGLSIRVAVFDLELGRLYLATVYNRWLDEE